MSCAKTKKSAKRSVQTALPLVQVNLEFVCPGSWAYCTGVCGDVKGKKNRAGLRLPGVCVDQQASGFAGTCYVRHKNIAAHYGLIVAVVGRIRIGRVGAVQ